ncbi:MAG: hypothetical protein ACM32F_10450 [Betaproteobacteria bacterium]
MSEISAHARRNRAAWTQENASCTDANAQARWATEEIRVAEKRR